MPRPTILEPRPHEHGLASGDVRELAGRVDRAWELFESTASKADLSAESRRPGWTAAAVVGRNGTWDFGTGISDLVALAHDGEAGIIDSNATDQLFLTELKGVSGSEVLASISRARRVTADWLAGDGPTTWGLVRTSSPLGPLPLLTIINAMTYQMAIASLDIENCGAPVSEELVDIGLLALVDTAGALAGRKQITGRFTAVTPTTIVGVGSRGGHWRTEVLPADPKVGPAAIAPSRTILDTTSGRTNVAHLYRTGQLHVRDLSGLIRLAPALEGVPGLPPLGAVGRALHMVDSVGGLLGRLRR